MFDSYSPAAVNFCHGLAGHLHWLSFHHGVAVNIQFNEDGHYVVNITANITHTRFDSGTQLCDVLVGLHSGDLDIFDRTNGQHHAFKVSDSMHDIINLITPAV